MSGSETGLMSSREPLTVALQQKTSVPPQPVIHNVRLAFSPDGAPVYKPITTAAAATSSPTYQSSNPSGGGGGAGEPTSCGAIVPHGFNMNMGSSEPLKRKRGRPRKYGPDGTIALGLASPPPPVTVTQPPSSGAGGFPSPPPAAPSLPTAGSASPTSSKKARGRPPGSSKKHRQLEALGSAGVGFTPHVITVGAGEDVSSKIMSFSQHGPRAVCVLSANGVISNVTLRQPATSGGTVTYEGRFEILSLTGSFMLLESGGQRSRTGGLSVSLSGPDGRVLGGSVTGLLTAAAPVQVVVGSFLADGRKESKSENHLEPLSLAPKIAPSVGLTGASSPPSRGTLSESSGGPGSPLNQSTGACNNSNPQGILQMSWK